VVCGEKTVNGKEGRAATFNIAISLLIIDRNLSSICILKLIFAKGWNSLSDSPNNTDNTQIPEIPCIVFVALLLAGSMMVLRVTLVSLQVIPKRVPSSG